MHVILCEFDNVNIVEEHNESFLFGSWWGRSILPKQNAHCEIGIGFWPSFVCKINCS